MLDDLHSDLERAVFWQNLLISRATGGAASEDEYRTLRSYFMSSKELQDLIPDLARVNRDLAQFWQYIMYEKPTYAERRELIWQAFVPLLDHLEASGAKLSSERSIGSSETDVTSVSSISDTSPKVFISYSWDDERHKDWVLQLAKRLRADGLASILDEWHLSYGDQIPHFMERSIAEADYVLVICTPPYRIKSEMRQGGVGYEGNIISARLLQGNDQRKYIPVLRRGSWEASMPAWLNGKYGVDLSGQPFSEHQYTKLAQTLRGEAASAPPVAQQRKPLSNRPEHTFQATDASQPEFSDITIIRVVAERVGTPRNDGSAGSALYTVPLALSSVPPREWSEAFLRTWERPPRYTTMHRPGIASVRGDILVLDGTTIEEVRDYHRDTLVLCVEEANRIYRDLIRKRMDEAKSRHEFEDQHHANVDDLSKGISFDQ